MSEKHQRARQMLSQHAEQMLTNRHFKPVFGADGRLIYEEEYFAQDAKARRLMLAEPLRGHREELFSYQDLAQQLEKQGGGRVDPAALSLDELCWQEAGPAFFIGSVQYCWQMDKRQLKASGLRRNPGERLSPDARFAAFVQEHNVWLRDTATNELSQVTIDGLAHDGYAERLEEDTFFISDQIAGKQLAARVWWSPDSARLAFFRIDQRAVAEYQLYDSVPDRARVGRPQAYSYKYPLPGDVEVARASLFIYDLDRGLLQKWSWGDCDFGEFQFFQSLDHYNSVSWSPQSDYLVMHVLSRDHKACSIVRVDAKDAALTLLEEEKTDSFHFTTWYALQNSREYLPGADEKAGQFAYFSPDGKTVYYLSQRSGYAHIYALAAQGGGEPQCLSRGSWMVQKILRVEESAIWFTATGREPGANPYYAQLYRLCLEDGQIELLSEPEWNHIFNIAPGGLYFTDYSDTVDKPGRAVACDRYGGTLLELLHMDTERLLAAGYIAPRQFTVLAADGQTQLHGIMILPADFDPGQRYPLLEYVYGAPQTCNVPVHFFENNSSGFLQSFAQLGMVTMIIDGRGTPFRGRTLHDYCYRNLGACTCMEDHVAAVGQLLERHDFIDPDRIGLWGHSGGGYATYQMLLRHGDLYRVGIASAGNHFQELYLASWAECFMAGHDPELLGLQSASGLAGDLHSKLLLIHGELDDNVHPVHTMRIVDELIEANRDFDLLIIPKANHRLREHPYYQRRVLGYFLEHLLHEAFPADFDCQ